MQNFNHYNPLPEDHEELEPSIEENILMASTLLKHGQSEIDCVEALISCGALDHEAVNAVRAASILVSHHD
jgi:hypothetical protein